MEKLFDAIGQDAEARYRDAKLQPQSFAAIAEEILRAYRLHGAISLDQLWQFLATDRADTFGGSDKPGLIPFYTGEYVRIVGHLWADAADRLHQHDWAGAFQLIEGESFNARYGFQPDREIAEFTVGRLARRTSEIFRPGDIQAVEPGGTLIHSVVYASKPGFAVSLRVASDGGEGVYEYLRPGLRCPSHRRRGGSALQLDLLAQALQVDDAVYEQRLADLVAELSEAEILRLVDALSFDNMPVPDAVRAGLSRQLDEAELILSSLDDIERSDRARDLLSDHAAPLVRVFICALFHSETRHELCETLQLAGYDNLETGVGRALSTLIIDEEAGERPTDHLVQALGQAALGGDVREAIARMRTTHADAPNLDEHSAFVADAFGAMEEAPIFRCLFKA